MFAFRISLIALLSAFISFSHAQSPELDAELSNLGSRIAEEIQEEGFKRVVVTDFVDMDGNVPILGRMLAEELTVRLLEAGGEVEAVDRLLFENTLQDHEMKTSDLSDTESMKKAGEVANVDAIITGSLSHVGEELRISIKLMETQTASLVSAGRGKVPMNGMIRSMYETQVELGEAIADADLEAKSWSPPAKEESLQNVTHDRFLFELLSFEAEGRTLTCRFRITNQGRMRGLQLGKTYTRFFDNFGNRYQVSHIVLGDGEGRTQTRRMLSPNAPIIATLTFPNVPEKAYEASVIEILYNTEERFKFRNVAIQR